MVFLCKYENNVLIWIQVLFLCVIRPGNNYVCRLLVDNNQFRTSYYPKTTSPWNTSFLSRESSCSCVTIITGKKVMICQHIINEARYLCRQSSNKRVDQGNNWGVTKHHAINITSHLTRKQLDEYLEGLPPYLLLRARVGQHPQT